eukprot:1133484-Prymnesium_polylepis.1
MAIMQRQRHVRQSRSTSTNVIHVIIYLSIYELGARHSRRQRGRTPANSSSRSIPRALLRARLRFRE